MPDIPELDRQHRALLDMLRQFGSIVENGGRASAGPAIDELICHACLHFTFEEHLMVEYGYPEKEAHQRKHRELIWQILRFKPELRARGPQLFMDWFWHWPFAYMDAHIACADKQVERYVREHDYLKA